MKRFDQLLAGYAEGDAISAEARVMRDVLTAQGMESRLYAPADRIAPQVADECLALEAFEGQPRDGVMLHFAIDSPVNEAFGRQGGQRVVRYHNITPSLYYRGFDDAVAARLDAAREALPCVCRSAGRVLADSEYNAAEVRFEGGPPVTCLPLLFEPSVRCDPEPEMLALFPDDALNLVYVGRVAPNKRIETLILMFAHLQQEMPRSRLIIVGSQYSCPRYYAFLRLLAGRLDLPNVCFTGFVTAAQKAACYTAADVFVTASEHEGFCLPLLEAMQYGTPVVARRRGGMPEALGGAGVMFDDVSPAELAAIVRDVARDTDLRQDILASQTRRLEAVAARDLSAELMTAIT